ncbi:MAG: ABC transporter ATP-binding protein [Hyphomicrobiales bacterium]
MAGPANSRLDLEHDPPIGEVMLQFEGVSSGHGGIPIVRDVTLDVRTGEVLAIVGRNGVGKTTFVDTVAGLLRASAGRIYFDGHEITARSASERARLGLGYVPQGRGNFARLTVEENLRMGELVGGDPNSADFERVYGWFPILRQRKRQRAGTLSGGEQQMLAVGRVLVGKPKLLVLDEPSEGIQPSIVQDIARIIRDQNETDGLTVLLVEQNIDLVFMTADRCVVMDKGTIATWLEPETLCDPAVVRQHLAI